MYFKSLESFFAFSVCVLSICMAPRAHGAQQLSEMMNLFLRVADDNGGSGITAEDCRRLEEIAEDLLDTQSRFRVMAKDLLEARCLKTVEDDHQQKSTDNSAGNAIWDGQPMCRDQNPRVLACEHNPSTGRGLFVLSGSDSPLNSPSLVCAHFEGVLRSPFDVSQEVDSRCVLTEYDWRYEGSRSDVQGMTTWVKSPARVSSLQIPMLLREQCQKVFADAYYCTPTLIILPERDPNNVSVCGLKTRDQVFGFGPILRIASSNSRWECESKSLLIPDKDVRLSVEERSCIPDHLGQLMSDNCRLPYMPVARKPLRIYIP